MREMTLSVLAALGLMTGTAVGDATHTPLEGTFGSPFSNGTIEGFGFTPTGGGVGGFGFGNLYDNILTSIGGAATVGFQCGGPFGDIPCGGGFVDWVNADAQWGDDLHGISAGGQGPAVVQTLYYGYANGIATSTHIIKLYSMVPPSSAHGGTTLIEVGALLTSIVVAGNPTGAYLVTLTGLQIQVDSAVWIKLEETGPGFPATFWLNGGIGNGVGTTHGGVLYTNKQNPPYPYDLWLPLHSFYFADKGYVAANLQVALSGFHVPAPATISVLGLGGVVALRRRRFR